MNVNKQVMQCFCLHLFSPTNVFEKKNQYFHPTLGHIRIRERPRIAAGVTESDWPRLQFLFFWLAFPFTAGLSFNRLCIWGILRENTCYRFFAIFIFCVATVKMLQSLLLFEIFLLKCCSASVTELYPIFNCKGEPYLTTLPT